MLRVDVATGAAALDAVDLALGGPLPLVVARAYCSRRARPPVTEPFGVGWQSGLGAWVELGDAVWTLRGGPFDGAAFAPVPEGKEARQAETGLVVQSHPDAVVVLASTRRRFVYGRAERRGTRLPLIAVRDRAGADLAVQWSGDHVARVQTSDGRTLTVELGGGRVRSLVLASGGASETVARYAYGLGGELVEATDAAGHTTRYGWDGDYLVELTDAEGGRQRAQYDADGRCLAVWHDRAPVAFALSYDPLRQTTLAVDAAGGQTIYAVVMGEQVVERIAPAGHSDTYIYDEVSRLVGFVRDGTVREMQRLDPEDRRLVHLHAETRVAFVQYDADGLAETAEDAFENRWTLTHADGAFVRLTTPLGAAWQVSRDRLGRATAVVSPTGRRWTLTHGATASISDDDGRRWAETRDARGRPVSRTDRLGRTTTLRWRGDHLEGVALDGPGAGYGIDAVRDGLGRIVRLTDAPARRAVRYTYDATGLVAACEVDGRRVEVRYDGLGRPIEAAAPGEPPVRIGYAANGQIRRVDTASGAARYSAGEGLAVSSGGGRRVYSTLGELLRVEGEGREEAFTYGPSGELMVWERTRGDASDVLLLAHDADGRLASLSGVLDAETVDVTVAYDADGRVSAVHVGPEPEPVTEAVHPELDSELAAARQTLDALDPYRPEPTAEEVAVAALKDPEPEAAEGTVRARRATVEIRYDTSGRPTRIVGASEARLHFDDGDRLVAAEGPAGRMALSYDVLDRPAEAPQRTPLAGDPGLVLVTTAGGVMVGVELGALVLPVWARGERRAAPMSATVRACVALVRGPAAALPTVGRPRLDALAPWVPDAARDLRLDATAVPRAADLGLPPGPLDLFALDASHLDAVPVPAVGALAAHQSDATRDDHDATTGPHRTGWLRPAPWRSRAVGPHLGGGDLLLRNGRVDPDALVDLALGL